MIQNIKQTEIIYVNLPPPNPEMDTSFKMVNKCLYMKRQSFQRRDAPRTFSRSIKFILKPNITHNPIDYRKGILRAFRCLYVTFVSTEGPCLHWSWVVRHQIDEVRKDLKLQPVVL